MEKRENAEETSLVEASSSSLVAVFMVFDLLRLR